MEIVSLPSRPFQLHDTNPPSYGVYIAILAGFIVVTWLFFPETKGLTIEEISAVFESGSGMAVASFQRKAENGYVGKRGLDDSNATPEVAHEEHSESSRVD